MKKQKKYPRQWQEHILNYILPHRAEGVNWIRRVERKEKETAEYKEAAMFDF